jgi:SAM-dependent methyltransferase
MRLIDVGSYGSMVPAYVDLLGIRKITISKPHQANAPASEKTHLADARYGDKYPIRVDRFDVEGTFPYQDDTFDLVIFTEVLEHLSTDPMQTLSEINRVTKSGGWLVLTTPNCASAKSLLKLLSGANPNLFPVYSKQRSHDRHNREYVANEVDQVLTASGYAIASLLTLDVYDHHRSLTLGLLRSALQIAGWASLGVVKAHYRGDTIFAVAQKTGPIRERYPSFLYV